VDDLASLLEGRYGPGIKERTEADTPLNPTLQSILNHRSCRSYLDRSVDDDLLEILLACAQSAPAKSNLQQYSIVVVRDTDRRARVAELVPGLSPWFEKAPVFLAFLGDVRRIRRLAEIRGHDYANNNADTFMNAAVDAALAMQNFIVAAESAGLGTCPISMIRNRIDEFAEILNLPDGVFPIAGLTLGWPDWGGMLSVRLPQSIVVHFETYDDDALNAEIDPHDDRAHERKPIKPGSQRHTDRYGVLEKCTWSENATRQLSEPERSQFAAFLKSKGIELK
jgi:nitroreductase